MTIENYTNLDGIEMVLILEQHKAESMTKAEYDRRQQQQVEHLTEKVAE